MSYASWHDFYYGAWQQPWALLVAPLAFLAWRGVASLPGGEGAVPGAKRFVSAWCLAFALETMLDPIATGTLAAALGGGAVATALGLLFVLLGDFRIWWLAFGAATSPRRGLAPALLASAVVPVFAWLAHLVLGRLFGPLPGQALWLLHECAFLALVVPIAHRQRERFARSVLAFAAVYYALWATSDVLILAGVDLGWLIRCVPNQLYYGLTVPFVWWSFFAASYASTSVSTQASR